MRVRNFSDMQDYDEKPVRDSRLQVFQTRPEIDHLGSRLLKSGLLEA
jgi:hypothetical protein